MNDYLTVLLLAAMPAAGNVFGGLLAEVLPFSRRVLSLALHGAAGIVLAVIGIELMGEANSWGKRWKLTRRGLPYSDSLPEAASPSS